MSEVTVEAAEQVQISTSPAHLELTNVDLWWQVHEDGAPDLVVAKLDCKVPIGREPIWLRGPSAGGKSTLLRALAGHTKSWARYPRSLKYTGSIELASEAVHACAERGAVGYAPQQHLFVEHISVEDNVRLPYAGRMGRRPLPDEDIQHVAERLRLHQKLKRPVHSLSGGERDRVAFMRAYLLAQNLLILDEPFGSSDTEVKGEIYKLCEEWLRREGPQLLVFTSHDAADAVALGAKSLHLEPLQGKERSTWRLE